MLDKIKKFIDWHPVLSNVIFILVTAFVLLWLFGVVFLGWWTGHSNIAQVPLVKGMNIDVACETLKSCGFEVKLDSIYNEDVKPGTVVEQSPRYKSTVKKGRDIFLRYVRFSARMVVVPYYENMSRRQIEQVFDKVGLKNWVIKEVPSDEADLVICVKYNGQRLKSGMEIPAGARLVIEVGAGSERYQNGYDDFSEELILPEGADSIPHSDQETEQEFYDYND